MCLKSGDKDVIKMCYIYLNKLRYLNIFILLAYKYIFKWCTISTERKLYFRY